MTELIPDYTRVFFIFGSMRIIQSFLLGILLTVSIFSSIADAQIYYVNFKDKPRIDDPGADFHPRALERRVQQGIEFPQESDLPLNPEYTQKVEQLVDHVRFELRWINAMTVEGDLGQMEKVSQLPFVTSVVPMQDCYGEISGFGDVGGELTESEDKGRGADSAKMEQLVVLQREMIGLEILKSHRLNGKGVRIAVFDAGFAGADAHQAFKHLRDNKQIVGSKDFYGNDNKVYHHGDHGTGVLSCLAGMYGDRNLGAATGAEFLLARTEHGMYEKIKEEDCWQAAAEWADREGADIISSSLGYGSKRYSWENLDGKTAPVTKAALMADSKGILVVNSAGNTGSNKFYHIAAPADAATVLTIGSSYPQLAFPMPYTSRGPNYVGVLKPNVSGPGYVVVADKKGGYDFMAGTSFACPSIAGVAACVKQLYPEMSTANIRKIMEEIGHLAPYYNYELGYGIPQVKLLFDDLERPEPGLEVTLKNDTAFVRFDQKVIDRDTTEQRSGKPLFMHWRAQNGTLTSNENYLVKKGQGLALPVTDSRGGKLFIWFEGNLWSSEEKGFVP